MIHFSIVYAIDLDVFSSTYSVIIAFLIAVFSWTRSDSGDVSVLEFLLVLIVCLLHSCRVLSQDPIITLGCTLSLRLVVTIFYRVKMSSGRRVAQLASLVALYCELFGHQGSARTVAVFASTAWFDVGALRLVAEATYQWSVSDTRTGGIVIGHSMGFVVRAFGGTVDAGCVVDPRELYQVGPHTIRPSFITPRMGSVRFNSSGPSHRSARQDWLWCRGRWFVFDRFVCSSSSLFILSCGPGIRSRSRRNRSRCQHYYTLQTLATEIKQCVGSVGSTIPEGQDGLQTAQRDASLNEEAARRSFLAWVKTDAAKPYMRGLSIATKQTQFSALGPIVLRMMGYSPSDQVRSSAFQAIAAFRTAFFIRGDKVSYSMVVSQDSDVKNIEFQLHSMTGRDTTERLRVGDVIYEPIGGKPARLTCTREVKPQQVEGFTLYRFSQLDAWRQERPLQMPQMEKWGTWRFPKTQGKMSKVSVLTYLFSRAMWSMVYGRADTWGTVRSTNVCIT